ncbi:DUF2975 domain-containing protein [Ruminiclostridium herbifermentans]|uniref:DUF2975 domain-containing protein n=1 Tax=Ruminiclostridium herbifermentans TaxID=2488810 RepID=A0A4U7JCK7_9FIRM|nr:DUF2975 domain-containing protein [Ruminiclostridium herbifermentans]QNU66831.1 DUF2975 domain-containing protein [Ruminiclostridium herbifermentans]
MNFQILGIKGLSRVMEVSCTIFQILGTILVLSLPWTLNYYLLYKQSLVEDTIYYSMIILLFISGVCGFSILHHAKKALHNINVKNPFTLDTANRIKYISYWCLPVAFIYLLAIFFIPSAFVLLVGLTFLFLAACIFIIAKLFYQAVNYKQENDLTI